MQNKKVYQIGIDNWMKEAYEKAVIEFELFQTEDVILTSQQSNPESQNPAEGGLPMIWSNNQDAPKGASY